MDYSLKILNCLMRNRKPLSTSYFVQKFNCDRKTVWRAIDVLETSGFPIEVTRGWHSTLYFRWTGKVVDFLEV